MKPSHDHMVLRGPRQGGGGCGLRARDADNATSSCLGWVLGTPSSCSGGADFPVSTPAGSPGRSNEDHGNWLLESTRNVTDPDSAVRLRWCPCRATGLPSRPVLPSLCDVIGWHRDAAAGAPAPSLTINCRSKPKCSPVTSGTQSSAPAACVARPGRGASTLGPTSLLRALRQEVARCRQAESSPPRPITKPTGTNQEVALAWLEDVPHRWGHPQNLGHGGDSVTTGATFLSCGCGNKIKEANDSARARGDGARDENLPWLPREGSCAPETARGGLAATGWAQNLRHAEHLGD